MFFAKFAFILRIYIFKEFSVLVFLTIFMKLHYSKGWNLLGWKILVFKENSKLPPGYYCYDPSFVNNESAIV